MTFPPAEPAISPKARAELEARIARAAEFRGPRPAVLEGIPPLLRRKP